MQSTWIGAMFSPGIHGDHHLQELVQRRFTNAGIGAEFPHDDLPWELEFRSLGVGEYTVHLDRGWNALDHQRAILDCAARCRSDAYGLVLHDNRADHPEYGRALREINRELERLAPSPMLFVEYARGFAVEDYLEILSQLRDAKRISACIDTGHVGIATAWREYVRQEPPIPFEDLRPDHPQLADCMNAIEQATRAALPELLRVIGVVKRWGKPLHFHLHDGHLLSTFSPYRVRDHLSFTRRLQVCGNVQPLMYGTEGLKDILAAALQPPAARVSLCVEVHPEYAGHYAQRPLSPTDQELFPNWRDLTNAEQINAWLHVLERTVKLVRSNLPSGAVAVSRDPHPG